MTRVLICWFLVAMNFRDPQVDQEGNILDILVQRWRDKHAAKKFFRKLLKGCQYVPRVIITDKLKSYGCGPQKIHPHAKSLVANQHWTTTHPPATIVGDNTLRFREASWRWRNSHTGSAICRSSLACC